MWNCRNLCLVGEGTAFAHASKFLILSGMVEQGYNRTGFRASNATYRRSVICGRLTWCLNEGLVL